MAYKIPAQTFDGMTITQELKFGLNIVVTQNNNFRLCAANGEPPFQDGEIWAGEEIYLMAFYIPGSSTKRVIYATRDSGKAQFYETTFQSNRWVRNQWIGATYTHDGKKVYCLEYSTTQDLALSDGLTYNSTSDVSNYDYFKLAWLMIYGGYTGFEITYDLENCIGEGNNPLVIQPDAPVTIANFIPIESTDEIYTFNSGSCWIDGQGADPGTPVLFVFDPETGNLRIGLVTSDITIHVYAYGDPYQETDGESDIPGGDSISVPGLPSVSATSSGVIGLFAPSSAQMRQLADYMWTDFGGSATTTDDILKEIVQAIKRSICNPLDYVIGLNLIPSDGLMIGASDTVRFGFTSSGISMPRLNSQFFIVNCGTLSFDKLCGDTFLDYAPYSKFSIYLPYIGFQDVDANDFVGHTIGVIYHGDVVTGAVTAYITKDGSVMYQYSGCCALSIPLNADGWGSTISGAVQIASSLITGAVSGGAAGVVSSAISGAANVAANPSLLSPQVRHSGAVSGGAGAMGVQKPFVVREAVRFHSTAGFNSVSGYPSYYYKQLSNVHGFTVVENVHLHGVKATNEEIEEIESLLKAGVIL